MTTFLKPELVILFPLLIGIGQVLKSYLKVGSKWIPIHLLVISFILASIYGLVTSPYTGWKMILDGIITTGLTNGLVAAFAAMGIYDTVTIKKEKKAA